MSDGQHILVCFALNEEAAPLSRLLAGRSDVHILVTGMGQRNAERELRRVLEVSRPRLVLTCGFAGGLNPELAVGMIRFEAESVPELARRLREAGAQPARFHCASRVVTTAKEKQQLRAEAGADAVEMESGVIRAVCREQRIPAATIRVISDTADEDLPLDFNAFMDPHHRLRYGKLAGTLLAAPQKIPALLKLQRQTRTAAENLARVIASVIPP
jgi:nucleoside phosphorylase